MELNNITRNKSQHNFFRPNRLSNDIFANNANPTAEERTLALQKSKNLRQLIVLLFFTQAQREKGKSNIPDS